MYTSVYTPNPGDGETPKSTQSGGENPLTSINDGIHYTTTPDVAEASEYDKIIINNFLQVLSEIALAIASRQQHLQE